MGGRKVFSVARRNDEAILMHRIMNNESSLLVVGWLLPFRVVKLKGFWSAGAV